MGWELRTGPESSMTASREGKTVVLPTAGLTYSAEESARLVAALDLNPYVLSARARPSAPGFSEILDAYTRTACLLSKWVSRHGPLVPLADDFLGRG
jgi:hypothetical protein